MKTFIMTSQGEYFDFTNVENNYYDIIDIASSLSKLCRFTGHCNRFYSVAQHSVFVSKIVPPEYAFEGLMHDSAEAFLGDVSSPLKRLLPDYQKIEKNLYENLARYFHFPENMSPEVKQADLIMLATEKRDLFDKDSGNEKWEILKNVVPLKEKITPLDHYGAYDLFIDRYIELCK